MNKNTASLFLAGLLTGILVATVGFSFFLRNRQADTSAGPAGKATLVLKLGHALDPNHPVHIAMEHMKKRLEELSGGTVSLDIYPSCVLGGETQMIEQLQNDALAMVKTSTSTMEAFIPEMAVFGLPYVFRDKDHYWKVLDGSIGRQLLIRGKGKNIRGLCYYDAGSRNFYTIEKPIMTPDDLVGLKIRVINSRVAMDMVRALGGSPTPISWGELYTALQQGTVDGAENNPPSFFSNKHYEVCKHFSLDAHTRIPDMLIIGARTWESLTPQVQKWLQQAADESSVFQRELWNRETAKALEESEKKGVKVYHPDQSLFNRKVSGMYREYDGTPIETLLKQIRETK